MRFVFGAGIWTLWQCDSRVGIYSVYAAHLPSLPKGLASLGLVTPGGWPHGPTANNPGNVQLWGRIAAHCSLNGKAVMSEK